MAYGQLFGDLGQAAADIFSAKGASAQQGEFEQGQQAALTDAQIAQSAANIKQSQVYRQGTQAIGGASSDIAGAGLTQGGTAAGVLRASAQQASLASGLAKEQGQIEVNGYLQQAASLGAEASAAGVKAQGSDIGAIFSGIAGIASLF